MTPEQIRELWDRHGWVRPPQTLDGVIFGEDAEWEVYEMELEHP